MRRDSHLLLAGLIAFAALVVGGSSASALVVNPEVSASKHKAGPYTSNLQSVHIAVGDEKSLYWHVKNTGGSKEEFTFTAGVSGDAEGFSMKWFKGKDNISHAVKGPGYAFKVQPNVTKTFTAVLKHKSNRDAGFCLNGQAGPPYYGAAFSVNAPCI